MKTNLVAIFVIATALSSYGSMEGILVLSSFHLESDGIGSSGKIAVEGRQNENAQMTSLKITAFGKDYVVPQEKLSPLAGLAPNGIQISYEQGYADLGGRTLYIQFHMGFTSSTVRKALITLTEDGKIEVGGIQNEQPRQTAEPANGNQPGPSATSQNSPAASSRH
jgi:hypothetical protein